MVSFLNTNAGEAMLWGGRGSVREREQRQHPRYGQPNLGSAIRGETEKERLSSVRIKDRDIVYS